MRRILAAIQAGKLTCSAAYRHRLEGALTALEALGIEVETSGGLVALRWSGRPLDRSDSQLEAVGSQEIDRYLDASGLSAK